jgi:excisionase family DNA binding protein
MTLGDDVFSGWDVARLCDVDLKTVHNWVNKGKLRCRRTEGRHLRIQRVDLVAFLRERGTAMPEGLQEARPRIALVDDDATELARLRRGLEKRFVVEAFLDGVDAILAVGVAAPQVVVARPPLAGVDLAHAIARLHADERTAHVRVIVLGENVMEGAVATIPNDRSATTRVRDVLEELTGLA